VAIVDIADVSRLADDTGGLFEVTVGIGLWLTAAAAVMGVVGWVLHRRTPTV
jgi:hypothetical protein